MQNKLNLSAGEVRSKYTNDARGMLVTFTLDFQLQRVLAFVIYGSNISILGFNLQNEGIYDFPLGKARVGSYSFNQPSGICATDNWYTIAIFLKPELQLI